MPWTSWQLTFRDKQTHTLPVTLSESPINLTWMPLDCGRKSEHLEKSACKPPLKGPNPTGDSNLFLWGTTVDHPVKHKPGNPTFVGCFWNDLRTYYLLGMSWELILTIPFDTRMKRNVDTYFFKNQKNQCPHNNRYRRYYSSGTTLPKSHL